MVWRGEQAGVEDFTGWDLGMDKVAIEPVGAVRELAANRQRQGLDRRELDVHWASRIEAAPQPGLGRDGVFE
jgi:hypothetical protein